MVNHREESQRSTAFLPPVHIWTRLNAVEKWAEVRDGALGKGHSSQMLVFSYFPFFGPTVCWMIPGPSVRTTGPFTVGASSG